MKLFAAIFLIGASTGAATPIEAVDYADGKGMEDFACYKKAFYPTVSGGPGIRTSTTRDLLSKDPFDSWIFLACRHGQSTDGDVWLGH